jgi:monofunctional biosynthetic peptidoglycan transglycosylase
MTAAGLILMTIIARPASADNSPGDEVLLTDFTPDGPDFGWYVLNDGVMGGRSEGGFEQHPGRLLFTGNTNTRGGGFSSIRADDLQLDLSNHAGVRLKVRGDGRRYTWRLTTEARWRGRPVAYWADFDTEDGAWTAVDIPFSGFVPKFRGYRLDGPALDTSRITGMGLMIYDDRDGPFAVQLASISAFPQAAAFTLADYRWNARVLVVSAPDSDDPALEAQETALAAAHDEFIERDLVLVRMLDVGVSTAGSRQLTNGEVAAARTALGIRAGAFALCLIGKDGSVKLSNDAATSMNEIYALIDTMPMRRREQSDR